MSLSSTLLDEQRRPAVVTDLVAVIDAEVKDKKGMSGAAIKAGYATVQKVSPNITTSATNRMLPDFASALEPFWTEFGGTGDFGSYLAGRGDDAAEALLAVTDARAAASTRKPLAEGLQRSAGPGEGEREDRAAADRRCAAETRVLMPTGAADGRNWFTRRSVALPPAPGARPRERQSAGTAGALRPPSAPGPAD